MVPILALMAALSAAPDDASVMSMYADCAKTCKMCMEHCQKQVEAGKGEHARAKAACHDCWLICETASKIDSREGTLAPIVRCAAGEACSACALECEAIPSDKHMAECAKVCRECAKMGPERIKAPKQVGRETCTTCTTVTTCTTTTRRVEVARCRGGKHRLRNLFQRLFHRRRGSC